MAGLPSLATASGTKRGLAESVNPANRTSPPARRSFSQPPAIAGRRAIRARSSETRGRIMSDVLRREELNKSRNLQARKSTRERIGSTAAGQNGYLDRL